MEINILEEFKNISDEEIFKCIQCGVCSSSCPISPFMELSPQKLIIYLINNKKEILEKNTIWLCASCLTCQARCRKNIDFSSIADTLRYIYLKELTKLKKDLPLEVDKINRKALIEYPQQLFIGLLRKMAFY